MQKKLFLLAALLLVVILGGSQTQQNQLLSLLTQDASPPPSQTLALQDQHTYLVTKIVDGDTIQIEGGKKVRYIGINTPELKGSQCFAKEAKERNSQLVAGKRIRLQKDVSETDKYGRLLRFVYTEQGEFVNNLLVLEGYALSTSYPPDISKQTLFRKSQQDAIQQNRGLWKAGCKTP